MVELLNNPVFFMAHLVRSGKTSERIAHGICDKLSWFLQMPAADQFESWNYIAFAVRWGLRITLLFDFLNTVIHWHRPHFAMASQVVRLIRFMKSRERALPYIREKEEGSSLLCVGNGKIELSGNEVDDSDQISG